MSRRQKLLCFRIIPALVAAAALIGASLAGWVFVAGSALFAGSALTGCPNGDAGLIYTPVTGIRVDAEQLVTGYGCGTGAGQVYKYAVLVTYEDEGGPQGVPAYSGVFDCFTDGLFSNLTPDSTGSLSFVLQVYAFNQASYPSELDDVAFAGDAGALEATLGAANWTTSCTATQQYGVSDVALCQPLAPVGDSADAGPRDAPGEAGDAGDAGDAGVTAVVIDTHGFVLAEGGAITCGGQPDAGVAGYDSVTASYGPTVVVTCPAPIRIAPATAGADYQIALSLAEADAQVATTQCQANAIAGQTVQATCAPATIP